MRRAPLEHRSEFPGGLSFAGQRLREEARQTRPCRATGRTKRGRCPTRQGVEKIWSGAQQSRKKAFALLLTVIMLSLSALALASLARNVFERTTRSEANERKMQDKYAEWSIEHVLLAAPALLGDVEEESLRRRSTSSASDQGSGSKAKLVWQSGRHDTLRLLTVADEHAKLSVNAFYQRDPDRIERTLREFFAESRLAFQPSARPLGEFELRLNETRMPPFTSPAQLVSREDAAALLASPELLELLDRLSLAGELKLRADRAPPEIVAWTLSPETSPDRIGASDLRQSEELAMRERLTGVSTVFSVRMSSPVRLGGLEQPDRVESKHVMLRGEIVSGAVGTSSAGVLREVGKLRW